ncbi:MAG: hypothetical protein ACQ9MH_19990 [Nitrospinales bacterium]
MAGPMQHDAAKNEANIVPITASEFKDFIGVKSFGEFQHAISIQSKNK